jgi:hypothetical protein
MFWFGTLMLLEMLWSQGWGHTTWVCSECGSERRGYSAATTTTATTRNAAQVHCAALGEQLLEAG